jgi:hypothetical protein
LALVGALTELSPAASGLDVVNLGKVVLPALGLHSPRPSRFRCSTKPLLAFSTSTIQRLPPCAHAGMVPHAHIRVSPVDHRTERSRPILLRPHARRDPRPLAWSYAILMFLNGVGHTVITMLGRTVPSLTFSRPAPGFYSSPLLLMGSVWLLMRLRQTASSLRRPSPV